MNSLKRYWIPFSLILLMAVVLRFYRLAEVPAGMTWDEAAIGYNGFALRETGRDEWLKFLPISFQSFGDYKAPLAIYLNGAFTLLFGLNLWAVRLPFALAGVMAVVGFGLLVKEIWQAFNKNSYFSTTTASLIGMSLLAFSPWHLHFSRIGFESGLALAELIWASYFLVIYLFDSVKAKWQTNGALILAVMGFAASFYTYHSAKIVAPLLILVLLWCARQQCSQKLSSLLVAGLSGSLLLLPLLYDSFFASGVERLSQTSLLALDLPASELVKRMVANYFSHFHPRFLLFGQVDTLRHGSGAWGVFLPTTVFLILTGLGLSLTQAVTKRKLFFLSLGWIAIGILPAAIGQDAPHSNRALLALPGFMLLALQGLDWLLAKLQASHLNQRVRGNHEEKNIIVKAVIGYFLLLHLLFFSLYLRHYYTIFATTSTSAFQAGYLEVLERVVALEKDPALGVNKILFSNEYGQPYIYTLFVRRTNPYWYHGGSLIKYEFANIKGGDLARSKAVVVASAEDEKEVDFTQADEFFYGPDGSLRFALFITNHAE